MNRISRLCMAIILCFAFLTSNVSALEITPNEWSISPSPFLAIEGIGDEFKEVTVEETGNGTYFKAINDTMFTNNNMVNIRDAKVKTTIDHVYGYSEAIAGQEQIVGMSYVIALKNNSMRLDHSTRETVKGVIFYVYYNSPNEFKVMPYITGTGGDNWSQQAITYPAEATGVGVKDGAVVDFSFSLSGSDIVAYINGVEVMNVKNSPLSEDDFSNGAYMQVGMSAVNYNYKPRMYDFTITSFCEEDKWIINGEEGNINETDYGTEYEVNTNSSLTMSSPVSVDSVRADVTLDNIPAYMADSGDTGKPIAGRTSFLLALKDNKNIQASWANRNDFKGLCIYAYYVNPTQVAVQVYLAGTDESKGNWIMLGDKTINTALVDSSELKFDISKIGSKYIVWLNGYAVLETFDVPQDLFGNGAYVQYGSESEANLLNKYTIHKINERKWMGSTDEKIETDCRTVSGLTGSKIIKNELINFGDEKEMGIVFSPENIPCYQNAVEGKNIDAGSAYSFTFAQDNADGTQSGIVVRFIAEDLEHSRVQVIKLESDNLTAWPYDEMSKPMPFADGELYYISVKEVNSHYKVFINGEELPLTSNDCDESIFDNIFTDSKIDLIFTADAADEVNRNLPVSINVYDTNPLKTFNVYTDVTDTTESFYGSYLLLNDTDEAKDAVVVLAKYVNGILNETKILTDEQSVQSNSCKTIKISENKESEDTTVKVFVWNDMYKMTPIDTYKLINDDSTDDTPNKFEEFRSPDRKYGIYQIEHEMDEKSPSLYTSVYSGGVVTNSEWREGKYLTDSNIQQVNDFLEDLQSDGLGTWIYDECLFPSGTADTKVLDGHMEYEAIGLRMVTLEGSGTGEYNLELPEYTKKIISLKLYSESGVQDLEFNEDDKTVSTTGVDGDWYLVAYVEFPALEGDRGFNVSANGASAVNRKYINILDKDAVNRFIEITYDAYKNNLSDMTWKEIEAFFTDEPSLITRHHTDASPDDSYILIPWEDSVPERFYEKYGYDIMQHLPSLFGSSENDVDKTVRVNFYSLIGDMVSENYFGNISEWCQRNGVNSSGHLLLEEALKYQIGLYGDIFKCFKAMDYPGIDVLTVYPDLFIADDLRYNGNIYGAKIASSAAKWYNKDKVMAELCPVQPDANQWQNSPFYTDYALETTTFLFFGGVNHFNSYFRFLNNADGKKVNDYVARTAYMLDGAKKDTRVAVYYPTETAQANYVFNTKQISAPMPKLDELNNNMVNLSRQLLENGIDYDFITQDEILNADSCNEGFEFNSYKVDTLIIPYCEVMPFEVLSKLEGFENLNIIFLGEKPSLGISNDEHEQVKNIVEKYTNVLSVNEIISNVKENTNNNEVEFSSQSATLGLYISKYITKEGKDMYFIANATENDIRDLTLTAPENTSFSVYNPFTGEVEYKKNGDAFRIDSYKALFLLEN